MVQDDEEHFQLLEELEKRCFKMGIYLGTKEKVVQFFEIRKSVLSLYHSIPSTNKDNGLKD